MSYINHLLGLLQHRRRREDHKGFGCAPLDHLIFLVADAYLSCVIKVKNYPTAATTMTASESNVQKEQLSGTRRVWGTHSTTDSSYKYSEIADKSKLTL